MLPQDITFFLDVKKWTSILSAWPWNRPWSCLDLFRQATPLNLTVLLLIWSMFWKILAAQLQGKSPAYYNGWKTYPSALDLFWKRAKQLLPFCQIMLIILPNHVPLSGFGKLKCFLEWNQTIFWFHLFLLPKQLLPISQTRTGERVAPGHYIFPRCKKMDFNSQCLTLESSMKLSRSFQASYTIKSHGSVVDLKHVLKNSGSTTTGQISCLLQWLENLPICLRFVLEKGKAVVTLFPNTTGQLQDLKDCSKEP